MRTLQNADYARHPSRSEGIKQPRSVFEQVSVPSSLVLVAEDYPQGSRWRLGERLQHVFEQQCDWIARYGRAGHLAVDAGDVTLTFEQLDARANQLARYLIARGARPGDRIALLFDQPVHSYVAMLAVLKINAAYVPLDVGFPPDRVSYIVSDAGVAMVLSLSHVPARLPGLADLGAEVVYVDEVAGRIARCEGHRLTEAECGDPVDELAYIIYTSGSTGRPKGVAISHPSICNFVRVAAEVYGITARDRVYQGMTIAFDFSVEEIWVPWLSGATLVPKPGGPSLLGGELHEFLTARHVTAMCCVPTLLATLDDDLPQLRFLLVSGEACPQDLVTRWHRPGRRFLNVYGPTEATVTATWTVVHPDRPVTIGVPLPTYATVILDPENPRQALPRGGVGEIGIAGIGLADGYLNRPDLTDRAFIHDFLAIPGNSSGRIYRTGDLGRVTEDGEIEYRGRIDTQVKIRGYRIELTEVESVLLQVPGIAQAVVGTHEPEPGVVELVGYYSLRTDTTVVHQEQIYAQLRERLPAYMVPAYLEHLDVIPMTTSDKADRNNLPAPTTRRGLGSGRALLAPATDTERILAEALAQTLRVEQVSVQSNFFDDLGVTSLLMAQFSARLRKQTDLGPVSMKDIYLNPTIRELAAVVGAPVAAPAVATAPATKVARCSTPRYVLCGALQMLLFLGFAVLGGVVLDRAFGWASAGAGLVDVLARAAVVSTSIFFAACLLPILAKWLLVGRFKPGEIQLWSLGYIRFWVVKVLIRANPMVLFAGSPLYPLYLRALGAKIGRGVLVLSRIVPVATDLITIGDGTLIRRDCYFAGYRAAAGVLQIGPVTLGRDVFVGEHTVLDIGTSMGDGAQLGHTSALHAGQAVPAAQRRHGSPAEPTQVNYRSVDPARCGTLRKAVYSAAQLLGAMVLGLVAFGLVSVLFNDIPAIVDALSPGQPSLWDAMFYLGLLAASFVVLIGTVLGGLLVMLTVPRVLNRFIRPGRVYPLYGFHYAAQQAITRLTNSRFYMLLLGDSSFIVHFVRGLGYDLCRVEQTGSNFGTEQRHDSPYLSTVGTGTMVSDGLSIMNADFSTTSFRVSPVAIGGRNFLGNNIAFPSGAKVGENCLLATKVMVPIEGPVRENVGLLGSPPFEIPRTIQRGTQCGTQCGTGFDFRTDEDARLRRLAAKNRYNAVTIAKVLLLRWIQLVVTTLLAAVGSELEPRFGAAAVAAVLVAIVVFNVVYAVLLERAVRGFAALTPQSCSIYDPYFWSHERLWKVYVTMPMFNGTPLNNIILRLAGVRIGRRVFDDGCVMPEKTLVTIGDDAVLNAGSVIQCHSLEDGYFASDHSVLGAGATIGVKAFVHYGVTVGDGSVLDADAFLMKGEQIAPHTHWQGNPATEIRPSAPVIPPASVAPLTLPFPARPGNLDHQEITMPIPLATPVPRPARTEPGPLTRPQVTGELPGPRSAELLARQEQRESNARVYPRHFPLAIAEASGSFIRDLDDNVFIDFLSGAGVLSLGHNHPELVKAASDQMGVFTHGLDFPTPAKDAFTDAQLSMLPERIRGRMKIHFCGPTGANAVDAALKLCKTATGRSEIVSFQGGFHGSSHAAMALTGLVAQKRPIAGGMPGVHFFPFSSCSRCPVGLKPETCQTNCVSYLEKALQDPNGGIALPAAVIMELVQGEGGVIPARKEFVQRVRALTRRLDIPLVVDEVQTGCGRTGTWFAFEQYDIEPDVIVASKALSGMGLPVAIILYDEKLDVWAPGAHSGTFRGNQPAFAAGAQAVKIIERDDVLANVRHRGEQIAAKLAGLQAHPGVAEVRGRGLMWGIELADPGDGRSVTELAEEVQARALREGLILELGGRADCVVRMLPPLNVTAEVVDMACSILLHAIAGSFGHTAHAA